MMSDHSDRPLLVLFLYKNITELPHYYEMNSRSVWVEILTFLLLQHLDHGADHTTVVDTS